MNLHDSVVLCLTLWYLELNKFIIVRNIYKSIHAFSILMASGLYRFSCVDLHFFCHLKCSYLLTCKCT